MYEYTCRVIKILNGNTIESEIDLGFGVFIRMNIKLFGICDSEQAHAELVRLLPKTFICQTVYTRKGKVGRTLAYVFVETENGERININDIMNEQGFSFKS